MKKQKNKKTNTNKSGAGRPEASINWPNKKFVFADLVAANKHVTEICLRVRLGKEINDTGAITKLEETRENSSGKGRSLAVYQKTSRMADSHKTVKTDKKKNKETPAATVNLPAQTSDEYEKFKTMLATPETVTVSVPVPVPAPEPLATVEVPVELVAAAPEPVATVATV